MTQTRSYTKAVSILRQFHDTLFAQAESLQTFLDDNREQFEQWTCYFDQISSDMIHFRRWQRRLLQRMQRFDGMKDGVRRLYVLIAVKSSLT